MFIKEVRSKIIKNSRKEKTIEVVLKTYKGSFVSSAPSGKSKGKYEVESFNERGVKKSLELLKKFSKMLNEKSFVIKKFDDLREFENKIKGFENSYGSLGGNVIYALETAFLKAAAKDNNKELWEFIIEDKGKFKAPMPIGNCIGGGMHSRLVNGKKPDFQEFLLIPDEKTFSRAVTKNIDAYYFAKSLLKKQDKKWIVKVNDEGAWMTGLSNEDALKVLKQVGDEYGLRIGIDIAASSFFKNKYYHYENKRLIRDRVEQIDYMEHLIKKYDLFYVEDSLDEEDFSGFYQVTNTSKPALIVGDDLTVTNPKRVERATRGKAINAMIIKPNQIGSLIDVKKVVDICKKHKIKMIFSHRSGETMDDAIADYCVGFQGDFIKTGIYGRERLIKLRRVMEIEKSLK